MKRRELFAMMVIAAFGATPPARAQQPVVPAIGFLSIASADTYAPFVGAFRDGLKEAGYAEGQNVAIEFRWAEGHYDRLPALAAELVHRQVKVMATSGGNAVARVARAASPTIPIVFASGSDPIKDGLVPSLNRPGGNTTGVFLITNSLIEKRIELLCELLPKATTIAMLTDPTFPNSEADVRAAQEAARARGVRLLVVKAITEADFGGTFTELAQSHAEGLVVDVSAVFTSRRAQLIALASHYAIPAIFEWRDFAVDGGLMSYGSSLSDSYHQVGLYVGRILKGENPGDLPVVQPTKVNLVVNLRTANALGLTVPQSILARADEVIE